MTVEELRASLSMPATLRRARDIIRQKVKEQDIDDVVSLAMADAKAKPHERLPRRNSLQAWFEGAMPEAPAVLDEAVEPVEDPGDAVVDIDPHVVPAHVVTDWRAEGFLLRRWMRERVANDPKDRETWAIMEELADGEDGEKLTYKTLAARHAMTEAQLYKRVERLREK